MGILKFGRRGKTAKVENPYPHFSKYTSVDCTVFAEAGYSCMYDQMRFTAEISPENDEFNLHDEDFIPNEADENELEESETEYAEFAETDDGEDEVIEMNRGRDETEYVEYVRGGDDRCNVSLSVKMEYSFDGGCALKAALTFFQLRRDENEMPLPLNEVLIKAGENRYALRVSNATISASGRRCEDEGVYYIGKNSLDALKDLTACVKRGLPCAIRIGYHTFTVSRQNAELLEGFLGVCDKAGVFDQDCFTEDEKTCSVITKFNK